MNEATDHLRQLLGIDQEFARHLLRDRLGLDLPLIALLIALAGLALMVLPGWLGDAAAAALVLIAGGVAGLTIRAVLDLRFVVAAIAADADGLERLRAEVGATGRR